MWSEFVQALRSQLQNEVVAGAVALGLVGVIAASLRNVPGALWSQFKRAVVVTATLDSRNDLFAAFVAWLDDQRFGQRSRFFTVVQALPAVAEDEAETDDAPRLQYSPAPGFHVFWHRGKLMWMQREIAMNMQVVETIRLGALFARRRVLEDLLEGVARHAGERRATLTLPVRIAQVATTPFLKRLTKYSCGLPIKWQGISDPLAPGIGLPCLPRHEDPQKAATEHVEHEKEHHHEH